MIKTNGVWLNRGNGRVVNIDPLQAMATYNSGDGKICTGVLFGIDSKAASGQSVIAIVAGLFPDHHFIVFE